MPRSKPMSCQRCPANAFNGDEISWNGLCRACGEAAALTNRRQLVAREGPFYDHWVRASYLKVRIRVLDELRRTA